MQGCERVCGPVGVCVCFLGEHAQECGRVQAGPGEGTGAAPAVGSRSGGGGTHPGRGTRDEQEWRWGNALWQGNQRCFSELILRLGENEGGCVRQQKSPQEQYG